MSTLDVRDAIVIGAGPAGSLAAYLLARAGRRVTLIEQHAFPRDKVCGECLSALGLDVLRRAGLLDRVAALSPTLLTQTALFAPDGTHTSLPLERPMWGVTRWALDPLLPDAAREAGAEVMQPARCEAIESSAVVVRDLRDNARRTLKALVVLVADGKGALLPERPAPTTDFGIKAHFTHVAAPRDTIELFGVRGHYGGVAPVNGGRWNVAFSVPATSLQHSRGDLDRLFASIVHQNRAMSRQFANAQRVSDWLASPLPRFPVVSSWPLNVIPLGNAAAALEPIGGEGMGLALRSAELAVETILSDRLIVDLRTAYRRLWSTRRWACRTAAVMLSSPELARPTVEFLSGNEVVASAALALIGKAPASDLR